MTFLTDIELQTACMHIASMPAGTYELRQIYGAAWASINNPTLFGARFKSSVASGQINGIVLGLPKTNNHQTYCIRR